MAVTVARASSRVGAGSTDRSNDRPVRCMLAILPGNRGPAGRSCRGAVVRGVLDQAGGLVDGGVAVEEHRCGVHGRDVQCDDRPARERVGHDEVFVSRTAALATLVGLA